jgi:hypothetical protein
MRYPDDRLCAWMSHGRFKTLNDAGYGGIVVRCHGLVPEALRDAG